MNNVRNAEEADVVVDDGSTGTCAGSVLGAFEAALIAAIRASSDAGGCCCSGGV